MKELSCTWVPGTMNLVRLKCDGRSHEVNITRLRTVFGERVLHDLYLKGRVILRAEARQMSLLA